MYYRVELDAPTRAFRVTSYGMWTNDIFDAFLREVEHAHQCYRGLGGRPNSLLTLVDLRAGVLQSQEISIRLQDYSRRYSAASERVAMLLSHSALHRAQARRIAAPEKHRFFLDEDEALAWLDEARKCYSMTA